MSKAGIEGTQEERPLPEVDRIRDIIMGPQMRLYEQQFRRINAQLEQIGKQLDELRAALDRQGADQQARTLKLEQETQQHLHSLEGSLTATHKQLEARVEGQNTDLAAQIRDRSTELRKQSQALRAEFAKAIASLEDDKTSRGHLGDLLMEMGTRLKEQAGIADLLGQLDKADTS
jgi:predicted  nucleic acid-binding Zn-ribbon protein